MRARMNLAKEAIQEKNRIIVKHKVILLGWWMEQRAETSNSWDGKLIKKLPGLVVRPRPLEFLGMGSIPSQTANVYKGDFPPWTLGCRAVATVSTITKSHFKKSRYFLITLLAWSCSI
jgi:hypothetical protein